MTASSRQIAKDNRQPTYYGLKKCKYDGTYLKNTKTGKCVSCEHYKTAIQHGNIDGIDGREERKRAFMGAKYD